MKKIRIPLLVRGQIIENEWAEFEARRGELAFETPDVKQHIKQLALRNPEDMQDLYTLRFEEVIDYLHELGKHLAIDQNPHIQQALEISRLTSGLPPAHLDYLYRHALPRLFHRDHVREIVEISMGDLAAMDGWTLHRLQDGRMLSVRPFGARCAHINAGNSPIVAALCVLRSCITRGDAVVKSPSNDPYSAYAFGRTMIDMAPDHPLTRHYSVAYWKGGDAAFEENFYRNTNFEKIVAWGGFESMKHITRYLGPGLELVAMDPKLSGTLIGREVFQSDAALNNVARRLAFDMGAMNQEACGSARVIYIESGTDRAGINQLRLLAERVYAHLTALPGFVSAPHAAFDPQLRQELLGLRGNEYFDVIGCHANEGGVIVSRIEEPVDFEALLGCRVCNLVPLDDIEDALAHITIHTQTIGVYPPALKRRLRNRLALRGGQRIVDLGHHLDGTFVGPHDALEPLRRLCRWVVDESFESDYRSWCESDPAAAN